jgi:hypothetical protein
VPFRFHSSAQREENGDCEGNCQFESAIGIQNCQLPARPFDGPGIEQHKASRCEQHPPSRRPNASIPLQHAAANLRDGQRTNVHHQPLRAPLDIDGHLGTKFPDSVAKEEHGALHKRQKNVGKKTGIDAIVFAVDEK